MAKRFTIREFRRSDFETLWKLDQTCFTQGIAYSREELAFFITRKSAFTLVAERGGEIVGFLVAEIDRRGVGHVTTIDVAAAARREGLGVQLMRLAEDRFAAIGCPAITLEAAVDNIAALGFYKRLGYTIVRTLPRYYSTGVDGLLLKKELATSIAKPATRKSPRQSAKTAKAQN